MSAGSNTSALVVDRNLGRLAPLFADAVRAAIDECNDAKQRLDVMVYEGYRSPQLQALYYQRGRTIIPPTKPVTYAPSNLHSWHGFGLAIDVVHRKLFWNPPGGIAWFSKVAQVFKKHGCNWGGDWTKADPPHFQWGRCEPSPSDGARQRLQAGGMETVWRAVGALPD